MSKDDDSVIITSANKKIQNNKKTVKKVFSDKIKIIKKLMKYETQLTSIYLKELHTKQMLGERYEKNIVADNSILSLTNITYSTLILLENSFYGSARVLLRQYFEYLVIGKFSEYDENNIIKKWNAKDNRTRKFNINLSADILNNLKGKNISEIRKMWGMLSDMSHPTKYSQQVPFIIAESSSVEWITHSANNLHYSFDLFFMLLVMNFHLLISNWGKKASKWYLGYHKDPMDYWKKEKILKEKIKTNIKEYYEINKDFPIANKHIKKVIFQYKQNWIVE